MSKKFFCNNCKTSKKFIANAEIVTESIIDESGKILQHLENLDVSVKYIYACSECDSTSVTHLEEDNYKKRMFIYQCEK